MKGLKKTAHDDAKRQTDGQTWRVLDQLGPEHQVGENPWSLGGTKHFRQIFLAQNGGCWKFALTLQCAVSLLFTMAQSVVKIVMFPMNPQKPLEKLVNRMVFLEAQYVNFILAMFFIPLLVLNDPSIKKKSLKKCAFLSF